jgi:hypothetical protein
MVVIAALIGLSACYQTAGNAPSPNAPSECANLNAEFSRLAYIHNSKVQKRIARGERTVGACEHPDLSKQHIAVMRSIVAASEQIDAKQCFRAPIGDRNHKILEIIRSELARCPQAQGR